jgi:hypothetical protein
MSRSLQFSVFTGLRQASSIYYPAHSKNGVNVSQRLVINAYMNIASKANGGKGRSEVISTTAWGKAADVMALCITPGKEFSVFADLHVYQGRVWYNDQPLTAPDGTAITTKKYGYTIRQFDLGNDAFKHIMNEIQAGLRGMNWWMQGTQEYENFRAMLKGRMTIQFDPSIPSFGFAEVRMPEGTNIAAYIPNQSANTTAMPVAVPMTGHTMTAVGTAVNPAAVAAAFGGAAAVPAVPAATTVLTPPVIPVAQPATAAVLPASVVAPAQSFIPKGV